jgi:hypothetical protein
LNIVGYRAVAINTVCDASVLDSKKKKKGEKQEKGDMIPPPSNQDIIRVSMYNILLRVKMCVCVCA